jgi:hypothetical protein
MQCLAFSKILTSQPPHRQESVYPPAFGAGGGHTRCVERGVGGSKCISEDARHSSVLYICKYIVDRGIGRWVGRGMGSSKEKTGLKRENEK